MNVNQSVPPVPSFGQPQPVYPGYHQSSYGGQSGSTAPTIPYGAYNGPVPGYQQTPPRYVKSLTFLGGTSSLNSTGSLWPGCIWPVWPRRCTEWAKLHCSDAKAAWVSAIWVPIGPCGQPASCASALWPSPTSAQVTAQLSGMQISGAVAPAPPSSGLGYGPPTSLASASGSFLTLVCMAPILRARLLPLARPKVILGSRLPSDLPHHRPPASYPQLQGSSAAFDDWSTPAWTEFWRALSEPAQPCVLTSSSSSAPWHPDDWAPGTTATYALPAAARLSAPTKWFLRTSPGPSA